MNPGKTANDFWPAKEPVTPVPSADLFREMKRHRHRESLLRAAAKAAPRGPWAEFGVASGTSAKILASERRGDPSPFFLFDSWEGMPDEWREAGHLVMVKGRLACPPPKVSGATIVKGLFEDTVPGFDFPDLALVHVDCDLEDSARIVLQHVPLKPGAVVVFDEFFHETKADGPFALGECKAWAEAVRERGIRWTYFGRCERWRAAVEVFEVAR